MKSSLWTTPTDLLKLVRAWQESLASNGKNGFIQADLARLMLTEVDGTMAMAWFAPRDPGIAFGHGGSNEPGWRCNLIGFAELEFSSGHTGSQKRLKFPAGCGICVMTNSAIGNTVLWKLIHAICYIQQWREPPHTYGYPEARLPFMATMTTPDPAWLLWKGNWSGGWSIQGDSSTGPAARFGDGGLVPLVPAAMPQGPDDGKGTIDVLMQDINVMLRLAWSNGKRVVILWQGGNGKVKVLERDE